MYAERENLYADKRFEDAVVQLSPVTGIPITMEFITTDGELPLLVPKDTILLDTTEQ